ncbi:hypothetical protein C8Q76DRAFT_859148 [Earliella scabrosa]|nr:hypothetical protein C8Q76DRAFT_859148 [Earliella scabrosa]
MRRRHLSYLGPDQRQEHTPRPVRLTERSHPSGRSYKSEWSEPKNSSSSNTLAQLYTHKHLSRHAFLRLLRRSPRHRRPGRRRVRRCPRRVQASGGLGCRQHHVPHDQLDDLRCGQHLRPRPQLGRPDPRNLPDPRPRRHLPRLQHRRHRPRRPVRGRRPVLDRALVRGPAGRNQQSPGHHPRPRHQRPRRCPRRRQQLRRRGRPPQRPARWPPGQRAGRPWGLPFERHPGGSAERRPSQRAARWHTRWTCDAAALLASAVSDGSTPIQHFTNSETFTRLAYLCIAVLTRIGISVSGAVEICARILLRQGLIWNDDKFDSDVVIVVVA